MHTALGKCSLSGAQSGSVVCLLLSWELICQESLRDLEYKLTEHSLTDDSMTDDIAFINVLLLFLLQLCIIVEQN